MVYKWYILPIGGLYATYHLLGEPGTTIGHVFCSWAAFLGKGMVFDFHDICEERVVFCFYNSVQQANALVPHVKPLKGQKLY